MPACVSDQKKLTALSKSKAYRDAYLSSHVRAAIAYQIQALREKSGLSQLEFAKKIGTTQSVISRLENPEYGKVTVQTLIQVALALDVALLVRFCAYPEFLAAIADVSPEALSVADIYETVAESSRTTFAGGVTGLPLPESAVESGVVYLADWKSRSPESMARKASLGGRAIVMDPIAL